MSDELVLLYTTGKNPQIPTAVIRSFFGLLEAVEAARDITDLAALRSIGVTDAGRGNVFAFADGYEAVAANYDQAGSSGLSFTAIRKL